MNLDIVVDRFRFLQSGVPSIFLRPSCRWCSKADQPSRLSDRSCWHPLSADDTGFLTSPEYPELYPNNTQCEWRISTPAQVNQTVFFQFNEFDLEHHDTCNYDRLFFYLPQVDNIVYNTVCGDTLPSPFAMPSYETGVVFQSDDIGAGKFNATYSVKPCGGIIQGQLSGSLASPNFPQAYGMNEYCIWVIVVEEGHSIGITWESFRVEHHNDCRYDYVKLFNGPSPNEPMIGNYCSPVKGRMISMINVSDKSHSIPLSRKSGGVPPA